MIANVKKTLTLPPCIPDNAGDKQAMKGGPSTCEKIREGRTLPSERKSIFMQSVMIIRIHSCLARLFYARTFR